VLVLEDGVVAEYDESPASSRPGNRNGKGKTGYFGGSGGRL